MARVISWVIRDKFVYLGTEENNYEPKISETRFSDDYISSLAGYWRFKNFDDYSLAYKKMYDNPDVNGDFTNLISPNNSGASHYFNVLANDGVIVISGKDAKTNTDTAETPYYNLHILNQNTSLGLGDNYVLDVPATAETEVYLERDGVIRNSETTAESIYLKNAEAGTTCTSEYDSDKEVYIVRIAIPSGTVFSEDNHVKKYLICVPTNNGFEAKVYFTVTGVKNGQEGAFYNLTVSPNIIKKVNGAYSADEVSVFYTKNGKAESGLCITYALSGETIVSKTDVKVRTQDIDNEENSTVTFELRYNYEVIDTETCTVVKDGKNAASIPFVELSNEMDGVALGNDNILDTTITIGSGIKLFSGSSEVTISTLTLKDISTTDNVQCRVNNGTFTGFTETGQTFTASSISNFELRFNNGFIFNQDYRETITVEVIGELNGTGVTASTNYIIIGVKGGKDGQVFRLQTSIDILYYNPNTLMYSDESISCSAFTGTDYIVIGDSSDYHIGYTINGAYQSYSKAVESGDYVQSNNLYPLPSGETSIGISSVTFYLFYSNEMLLLDRETVPVVVHGINGSDRTLLELGNEIYSVGLGGDNVLDIETTASTEFFLYSGASLIPFTEINVYADSGFAGYSCVVEVNGTEYSTEFDENGEANLANILSDGAGTLFIGLESGLTFDTAQNKNILIEANNASIYVSESALFTIMGVKNGADGVSYQLIPTEDSVVLNPNNGDVTPEYLNCDAYVNGEKIELESGFEIRYSVNEIKTEKSETSQIPINGIDVEFILESVQNLERIYFYLFKNDNIIDRESVPLIRSGEDGEDGQSPYYLDLDNQNTSVNCDKDGKILSGAVLPDCKATLYFGGSEAIGDIEYSIETATTLYTGASIDLYTGVITLNSGTSPSYSDRFNFNGDKIEFTIKCEYSINDEIISRTVIFTVSKSYPGEPGAPGEPGEQGKDGKCLRRTVWEAGKTYYNGEFGSGAYENPNFYYDVVSDKDISIGSSGVSFYECLSSHTSSDIITYTDTRYWRKLNDQEPFVTPLILADVIGAEYIDVGSLSADTLTVTEDGIPILIAGSDSYPDYPFICGGSGDPIEAPTKISKEGEFFSKYGTIGGWKINNSGLSSNRNEIILNATDRSININSGNSAKMLISAQNIKKIEDIFNNAISVTVSTGKTTGITETIDGGESSPIDFTFENEDANYFTIAVDGKYNISNIVSKAYFSATGWDSSRIEYPNSYSGLVTVSLEIRDDSNEVVEELSSNTWKWNGVDPGVCPFAGTEINYNLYNGGSTWANFSEGQYKFVTVVNISVITSSSLQKTGFIHGGSITCNITSTRGTSIVKRVDVSLNNYFGNGLAITEAANNYFYVIKENYNQQGISGKVSGLSFAISSELSKGGKCCGLQIGNNKDIDTGNLKTAIKLKLNSAKWTELCCSDNKMPSKLRVGYSSYFPTQSSHEEITEERILGNRYIVYTGNTIGTDLYISSFDNSGLYFYMFVLNSDGVRVSLPSDSYYCLSWDFGIKPYSAIIQLAGKHMYKITYFNDFGSYSKFYFIERS